MRPILSAVFALVIAAGLGAGPAVAQDQTVTLVIKNHRFDKAEIELPANKRITLVVKNEDPTPEEFESHELRVEKVIPGGKEIRVTIGPLKPGRYRYFGEYHEDTAVGYATVK